MGPQRLERAWGLAPAFRAQRRRFALPSAAPYRRARSILPCRPTLAVPQPCLQRTPALLRHSREERACPPSMGPQRLERDWVLAPTSRAQHHRSKVLSVAPYRRACYLAVPPHTGDAPAVPEAHAALLWQSRRSACDHHRWGHCTRSGPGGWRLPPELTTVALRFLVSCRTGARALSFRAVPHWRCSSRFRAVPRGWCSSRASSARPHCSGIYMRSVCDRHRWGVTSEEFAALTGSLLY